MDNNENGIGLKVALGIALGLFLIVSLYTVNLYRDSQEAQKQLQDEKQLVMTDLNEMARQYDQAIKDTEEANGNLLEARAEIQGLIDSLHISETNIKSLLSYKKKYVSLQKQMNKLLAQNRTLKAENSNLATSLDSTRVRLEERTVFTDSLLVQNNALAQVVEKATALNAVSLKGFGVIKRSSGKLIPTERAGRTDKIRVCFTVPKNSLVPAGNQELYVQVIDPKHAILGLNKQIEFEDKVLNYSVISKFNYEEKSLNVCEFVGAENDEFEKGLYIVNVFNEKDLVSRSEFTLK